MMRLFLFFIIIISSSCVSNRPVYDSIEGPDYNGRIFIKGAKFKRKLNPIGIGVTIGATTAGAYAGYRSGVIVGINKEGNKVSQDALNTALGGIVGFGLSSLANYFLGRQSQYVAINSRSMQDVWLKKYDKKLINISFSSKYSVLEGINKASEGSYSVLNFKDALDFNNAFPRSKYRDIVFKDGVNVVERSELLNLIELYDDLSILDLAKIKYAESSSNIEDLFEAKQLFPRIDYDYPKEAVKFTGSIKAADKYFNEFGVNSRYTKDVFVNSLVERRNRNQAMGVYSLIGSYVHLNKGEYRLSDLQSSNYFDFLIQLNTPLSLEGLIDLKSSFSWLRYHEEKNYFISVCFDVLDNELTNGKEVLRKVRSLPVNSQIGFLGISNRDVSDVLKSKFEQIAKDRIIVSDITLKEPEEDNNFKTWENSFFYDAPYVNSIGELKFLFVGSIYNDSKYDLPVYLDVNADLSLKHEGEILNFQISKFADAITGGQFSKNFAIRLGSKYKRYFVPVINSGEAKKFAVLFDYGIGSKKKGINIFGFQGVQTLEMNNVLFDVNLIDDFTMYTVRDLNQQQLWLSLANKSLGKYSTKELFGIDYKPQNYQIDFSESFHNSGNDCGCFIKKTNSDKYWVTGEIMYYTLVMDNGYSIDYTRNKDGTFEMHDGILGLGRSQYSSLDQLHRKAVQDCIVFYNCR